MKKVLSNLIVPAVILTVVFSCENDDILNSYDVLDIAPVVDDVSPSGSVKVGSSFDIIAYVSDGESSPLANVAITLFNNADTSEIASTSGSVSGTSDSLVWAAADAGTAALDTGEYLVRVTATDNANLSSTADFTFIVFDLPFDANYPSMYMLGGFNGWGGSAADRADWSFELIGPNVWELKETAVSGEWKFSVNPDFDATDPANEDWGDGDCDGVMSPKSGGGNSNTNCGYDGEYNITFNDESFEYSLELVEAIPQNIDDLYLAGTFNGFRGNADYHFTLESANTWVLAEAFLKPGDEFIFSEAMNFSKDTWGDDDMDGTADIFGANIVLADDLKEGYYMVSFNDATLDYEVTYVRGNFGFYIIGDATVAGWDNTLAYGMVTTGTMQYRTFQYLTAAGGFQFLPNQGSWDGQIGKGASDGVLTGSGGANITVPTDGFYRVDIDVAAMTYTVTESTWGVVGDATPGGWPGDAPNDKPDSELTLTGSAPGTFSLSASVALTAGEMKFRENKAWDFNYGDDGADGTLQQNGANIVIGTAGTYTITLTLDSEAGLTYTLE